MTLKPGAKKPRGDPMEMGLIVAAEKAGLHKAALEKVLPEIDEVPFSSDTRFSASVHDVRSVPVRALEEESASKETPDGVTTNGPPHSHQGGSGADSRYV